MIHFSNHAIDRYRERVKPHMKRNHVKRELQRLAKDAELSESPPAWWDTPTHPDLRFVEITDGIALACLRVHDGWLAKTVCIRAGKVERAPKRGRQWSDSRQAARQHRKRKRQEIEDSIGEAA